MTTDYRALCAELLESAEELDDLMQSAINGDYMPDSFTLQPIRLCLERVRAALAQSEPVDATDYRALCTELVSSWIDGRDIAGPMQSARAALSQPEAVAADLRSYLIPVETTYGTAPVNPDDEITIRETSLGYWTAGLGEPWPDDCEPEALGPSDEEIMELMSQQMHEDLAAAARALAEQASTISRNATGVMRIMLNRHAVDLARAVLARWDRPPSPPSR